MSLARSEVLMGIEIEVDEVMVNKEALPTDPLIDRGRWKLFTDMSDETGYTIEFATVHGYKKDQIVEIAKEMQESLLHIIDSIGMSAIKLFQPDAFRKLVSFIKENTDKLATINQKTELSLANEDSTLRVLKKSLYWFLTALEGMELSEAKKQVIAQRDSVVVSKVKKEKEKLEKKIAMLNAVKTQGANMRETLHYLLQEKRDLTRRITAKVYLDYIHKMVTKLIKPQNLIDNSAKENYYQALTPADGKINPKLKQVIKLFLKRFGFVSHLFYKHDGSIRANKRFQPYCTISAKNLSRYNELHLCTPGNTEASFQITLQLPLSAVPDLLKYYTKDFDLNSSEKEIHQHGIPHNLVQLSHHLLYEGEDSSYYEQAYPLISTIWNVHTKNSLMAYMDHLYGSQTNDRQAKGLFFLFLSYAMEIFNRADTEEEQKIQEDGLPYGPKRAINIMSRVSFSGMFDRMPTHERVIFKTIVTALCNPPKVPAEFQSAESMQIDESSPSVCDRMLLVRYQVMAGFDYDPKVQVTDPLSLSSWFESIINPKMRIKNQPKIVNSKPDSQNPNQPSKIVEESSDKVSPPICYSRNASEEFAENDKVLIKKYQNKAIYSMGAYTHVKEGHTVLELRAYPSVPVSANGIHNFAKKSLVKIFEALEGSEAGSEESWEDDETMTEDYDVSEESDTRRVEKLEI